MAEEFKKIETKEQEFSFENWVEHDVKKQYEEQVAIFHEVGLLEFFPEKQAMGIVGIDGREYPIPEIKQVQDYLRENKKKYEEKVKQGFTELSMT
jgi:hypothetical protein